MDYRYLITYFKEPIAIANTETQALKAIREDIRQHQTNRQDYDIIALRYYEEKYTIQYENPFKNTTTVYANCSEI